MRILLYGETPCIETGAARVSRYLLAALYGLGHDIEVVAINHPFDSYSRSLYPYTIHRCPSDEMHNVDLAREKILHADYDLLLLTGDVNIVESFSDFVLQRKQEKSFLYVVLAALDCDVINPAYLRCLEIADMPVVYSEYAQRTATRLCPTLQDRLKCIQLGCEPDVFFPLPENERQATRKDAFGCDPDRFLVVSVNRNQPRKDLARTMYAFHCFHDRYPNSRLYMHAKMQDVAGSLPAQASYLGLRIAGDDPEVLFAHSSFHEMAGVSTDALNRVYNAADVCISMSTGEAWGLTTTEAMAASRPVIGPNNTAFPELLGDDRGFLIKSGGIDLWSIHYGHSEGPREMVSVSDMVRTLEFVYQNREEAKRRAALARKWTLQHTWQYMMDQWQWLMVALEAEHARGIVNAGNV